ncbi:MAG TPA: transposase [Lacipirellulaceae bacterium]|nr:transposase [Lacipirellulaceae bacterium]
MPNYRRYYVLGGTYFFTIVTYRRRKLLTTALARSCLHAAIEKIQHKWPFEIVAIVLLPDHWHTVWTLPPGDSRYSLRLQKIKEAFTRGYLDQGGTELAQSRSRHDHGLRGVWQKRFWEHTIDDEDDLKRCVELYSLESKETWIGDKRPGLALVVLPPFCCGRRVYRELGPKRPDPGIRRAGVG